MTDTASFVEGQLVVLFKKGVTEEEAKKLIESWKLSVVEGKWHKHIRMLVVTVPGGEEWTWLAKFKSNSLVAAAYLNRRLRL